MQTTIDRLLAFTCLLFAGFVGLLLLAVASFGGRLPRLSALPQDQPHSFRPFAREPFVALFAPTSLPPLVTPSNAVSPFWTLHFQPPAPPQTRKIELLYQGCYESSGAQFLAFVRLGDSLLVLTNGAKAVADHAVMEISTKSVVLTNTARQTNVLDFNVPKTLEVPAS